MLKLKPEPKEDGPPNEKAPEHLTPPPLQLDLDPEPAPAEPATMPPPDALSADPVLDMLREIKAGQEEQKLALANFQIENSTRLTRLEGYAKVLEGNLLILRADAEETKRDVKTVDGKVDQLRREVVAGHQVLGGVAECAKSTYDMVTGVKRIINEERGEQGAAAPRTLGARDHR